MSKSHIDSTPLLSDFEMNINLDMNNSLINLEKELEGETVESKRPSVMRNVAGFIIVTEFCERLSYYGFAGSLVLLFQTQLNLTNEEADVQFSIWSSACYITPLLGGYLADSYLGRYKTITLFCTIYLIGLIMIVLGCIPGNISSTVIFIGMYIIALASGGIKPNVSTMGADQFNDNYPQDRKEKESFFNWFYWSINLGALISYTLVSYICQFGIPSLGGVPWGFFVGYSIPAIMMGIAILVFLSGTKRYTLTIPQGSLLGVAFQMLYESLWSNRHIILPSTTSTNSILLSNQKNYKLNFLYRASKDYGGSFTNIQIESIQQVIKLIPYSLVMIPYWSVYSQMSTGFQNQGCQMDLSLGNIKIPVSALNMFDTAIILLLVPIFDTFLYPFLKRNGYPLSMLKKIGLGFLLALVAMLTAAWVEEYRLSQAPPPGDFYDSKARMNISPCQQLDDYNPYLYQQWINSHSSTSVQDSDEAFLSMPAYCHLICDFPPAVPITNISLACIQCDDIPQMTSVSVFLQIPQFALIGASEILASVTALEFFYSQSPVAMRSLCSAMNLLTSALGSLLMIPLLKLVNANPKQQWLPSNLDKGHLNWYFYVLAIIMAVNQIYFWWLTKSYEYNTEDLENRMELLASDADEENTINRQV